MKNKGLYFIMLFTFLLSACSTNDDNNQNNNPNIPNAAFDTGSLINTSLPQYNQMQFPGNYIVLNNNYGINGVVVYYAGGTNYSAFELSDPNHQITNCSQLTVNGTVATCSCDDDNAYNFAANGLQQPGTTGQYTLVPYRVEVSGDVIRVSN